MVWLFIALLKGSSMLVISWHNYEHYNFQLGINSVQRRRQQHNNLAALSSTGLKRENDTI